jgi:hypothetical protein
MGKVSRSPHHNPFRRSRCSWERWNHQGDNAKGQAAGISSSGSSCSFRSRKVTIIHATPHTAVSIRELLVVRDMKMRVDQNKLAQGTPPRSVSGLFPAFDYAIDAAQRTVLFWDVMRQRGNQYREHLKETAPHVLDYEVELVADGRKLERPVNYALVRIVAPKGIDVDLTRRPFVVVDPRADTVRASAASRPTAKSASRLRPAIHAISSASFQIRCRVKRSKTSPTPRQSSSRK